MGSQPVIRLERALIQNLRRSSLQLCHVAAIYCQIWVPLKHCLNEKLCTEMAVTIVMFEDKIMCSVTPSAVCWLLERKDVWWELLDQGFRKSKYPPMRALIE